MTDLEQQTITLADIEELTYEDGGLSLYAKGHWDAEEFAKAAREYLVWEYEDWYGAPSAQQLQYGWARMVPHFEYGVIFWPVTKVRSTRGVFPYTMIEGLEKGETI